MALKISDRNRQLAMLLHYVGENVHDIYDTLDHTPAVQVVNGNNVTEDRFHQTVRVLTEHFNPKRDMKIFRVCVQTSQTS